MKSTSLTFFNFLFLFLLLTGISACRDDASDTSEQAGMLQLSSVKIGGISLNRQEQKANIPPDQPVMIRFGLVLDETTVKENLVLKDTEGNNIDLQLHYLDEGRTISAKPQPGLELNTAYSLSLGEIKAVSGEVFPGMTYQFKTQQGNIKATAVKLGTKDLTRPGRVQNVSTDLEIITSFSTSLNKDSIDLSTFSLKAKSGSVPLNIQQLDSNTLSVQAAEKVDYLTKYVFEISSEFDGGRDLSFNGFQKEFYTALDSTPKLPVIGTAELLTLVQRQTFSYFWDFAHPVSGLARERNTSGDIVTIGGSGFGVMSIPVGIERGFISRQEGMDRLEKIVSFLQKADRFHGAWPHWMNGNTGEVIPFSQKDNGGDLVETSFMIQGLLTVRQYLNPANEQEAAIIDIINQLWRAVEWDWYTQGGENVLYWHWSPDYGFEMNHQIRGYNEAFITYVLAAASPAHAIAPEVYHQGWAQNGEIRNNKEYYGIRLPLGPDYGGPLFFAHYSFLGLDPRNLEDTYANYFTQNAHHSQINRAYVMDNPQQYVGYGKDSWGLTASDNHRGYSAHSPTNDLGVITPTAAIASIPYTPDYSIDAIEHFYYLLGDRLWGEYGFYDAFNFTEEWVADSYLAIDQGPIVLMIENYRTAMLWELFMSNPEIQQTLPALGFTSFNKP